MNQVFIVRPFGIKNGIDFEQVEARLIRPAIAAIGWTGGTTGEIIKQGNIRADMFQKLLVADLVIADISIHNANAFYELGVRHAFRDKRTFLIRCGREGLPADAKRDEVPFDLKTDRYLEYRLDGLDSALARLIPALRATVDSQDRDSPIFQLLPKLEEYDHEVFLTVPLGFREEVERAAGARQAGDLLLLAAEATSFEWALTGLRLVGQKLFDLKHWDGCRTVWERVRERLPLDPEANLRLGTVYQRLQDLTRSDLALARATDSARLDQRDRAEAFALRGRNAKQRWQDGWATAAPARLRADALRSAFLHEAYREYARGFEEDQNHYYSGLNALAMLTVILELAAAQPAIWEERFDDLGEAAAELTKLKQARQHLAGAVECSLNATRQRDRARGTTDPWLDASLADLRCLTSTRPERVANAYRTAIDRLGGFSLDSVRRQLLLYRQLGLLGANVDAALALSGWDPPVPAAAPGAAKPVHVLLFTGHRIDAPGRPPRFPADKEPTARQLIRDRLASRLAQVGDVLPLGIAGGASGGDILFHEICAELGVATELHLALPANLFVQASVQEAGLGWENRFYALHRRLPSRTLAEEDALPVWLRGHPSYGIWQRNNLWMLHNAVARAGRNVTLIALWDRQGGDGPGGTEHMVREAEELDARVVIIDTRTELK